MKFTKKNGGFTLVELIVVIAILAILAAIAVPAYSGYISKANEAADQQLLASVNTAFAAACLENNEDMLTLTDARITLKGTAGNMKIDMASVKPYGESFETYFAANKDTPFKVITALKLVNGVFVDAADSPNHTSYSYAGSTLYWANTDIENLQGTNFVDVIGTDKTLDSINNVTNAAANMFGGTLANVAQNEEFVKSSAALLGLDPTDPDIQTKLTAKLNEMTGGDASKQGQIMANAAVLFAAQNASNNMSREEIGNIFNAESFDLGVTTGKLQDKTTAGAGMTETALIYGMYTSYQASLGNTDTVPPADFVLNLSNEAEKNAFLTYVNGEEGQKNLTGYLSALEMINASTNDQKAVEDVLLKGFGSEGNEALADLVEQAMKGSN